MIEGRGGQGAETAEPTTSASKGKRTGAAKSFCSAPRSLTEAPAL